MSSHHKALWAVQWVFGIYFIAVGTMHFIVPDGLPDLMSWMYELDDNLHMIAGVAEIAGGLGLILPGLTGVTPQLSVLAAVGLIAVMLGAVIWHSGRGEALQIATNLFNIVAMGYVAYGRWKLAPLTARAAAAA